MKGLTTILFLTVLTISCADVKNNNTQVEELQAELDSLKKLQAEKQSDWGVMAVEFTVASYPN